MAMNMQTYATYQVLQRKKTLYVPMLMTCIKLFLMQAGMVNGSFVHMMLKAVKLVHMNVKMDRYTLNHRASVLGRYRCQRRTRQKAMDSVEKILDTKYGIMILQPAYRSYHLELGEVSSYPPGYKENAGIFCHNNPWVSIAETVVDDKNRAFETYKKICPAYLEEISEIHRTEPYVYSQMIAGKDAARFGEAKNSWLTGTAAWTFTSISQYILGVRASFGGLTIDPCLPDSIKELTITRKFRGATYNITISNTKHERVSSLIVNGNEMTGNTVPFNADTKEFNVIVNI